MSLAKLSTVLVLVLASLLVAAYGVDPGVHAETRLDAVKNRVYSHVLLPEETIDGAPARWLLPHLRGRGSDKSTLAVRGDNMRFAGFTNQDRTWHASRSAGNLHLVPPARPRRLSFDDDYTSLIGGHKNLKHLRVSREAVLEAISELSRFGATNRTNGDDDGPVRRALATLRVAIIEPQRFVSINESVISGWDKGGISLDDRQIEYVAKWKTMSCALLIAEQNGGAWPADVPGTEAAQLRSIGMFSKEDVLREIGLVMWPKDCSEPITASRKEFM